eukprot:25657_1
MKKYLKYVVLILLIWTLSMICILHQTQFIGQQNINFIKINHYTQPLNWSQRLEAFNCKFIIHSVSQDRGRIGYATKNINKSEQVCFVPFHDTINGSAFKLHYNHIYNQFISHSHIINITDKHSLMALYILYEQQKGKHSKWQYYIDLFPKNFSNIPIYYTQRELNQLNGSVILDTINTKLTSLHNEYNAIHNIINIPFSFEEYKWAITAVQSRVFGWNNTIWMIPVFDMLNHNNNPDVEWDGNNPENGFIFTAINDIKYGNEIYTSYGEKSNIELLLLYGFILDYNHNYTDVETIIKYKNNIRFKVSIWNADTMIKYLRKYFKNSNESK